MRRRRLILILGGVAVVIVAWSVLVGLSMLQTRDDARAGIDRLEAVRDLMSPEDLVDGVGIDEFRAASADFESAHDRLRSPLVSPARLLPVVGRQIRSVDALTGAAKSVIDTGVVAIEDSQTIFDRGAPGAQDREQMVRQLGDVGTEALAAIAELDLGPDEALLGPVADARSRFEEELDSLRETLASVSEASAGLADFLGGPSRYLVLAANNAEMRVGSGAFLSVGVLEVADGRFALSEMIPAEDLLLAPGEVALDGELADLWGWLEPNREWRNLASSPRFETQAALAAEMWKAATGENVDGVLALDPVALAAILDVVGPVEVDGREIGADQVVDEILLGQYVEFATTFDQTERRDRLSEIAGKALSRLDSAEWEPVEFFEALRDASDGRHLLAWSGDPSQLAGWRAAGVTGELEPDGMLVGVHNRGGNKLDQFLDVQGSIEVETTESGSEVSAQLDLTNAAPTGLPQYVAGPYVGAVGGAEGLYQGLVVAQVPGDVTNVRIENVEGQPLELAALGPDGPNRVVATLVEIPRDSTETVVVRFEAADTCDRLVVEPSARTPEIRWAYGGEQWVDDRSKTVIW